jgi:hypothetical protein
MRLHRQRGQAMAEFLVVAAALALALFYPYLHGESVGSLLVRTLMRALRVRSFLISVL